MKHIEGLIDLGLGVPWDKTHMASEDVRSLSDLRVGGCPWRACPLGEEAQKVPWKDRRARGEFVEMQAPVDEANVGGCVS